MGCNRSQAAVFWLGLKVTSKKEGYTTIISKVRCFIGNEERGER